MERTSIHIGRLAIAVALCASVCAALPALASGRDNPIVVENHRPGTTAWQLRRVATDAGGQIKGYASAASVDKGGAITFYVTVNPTQTYSINVYRIGWYGGRGGRLMRHVGHLKGARQPDCPAAPTTGMVACNWRPSYRLTTKRTWTSGIYLAVLTNARQDQNYIIFTVRDDRRATPLLYQQPVKTYQAYNGYPEVGAVTGQYTRNCYGSGNAKNATKVSFDRPYSGSGAGQFLTWEINFVRWLERSGFDVSYSTDIDTHAHGNRLLDHRGFLSVGHDEYWSRPMYDAAMAARDGRVNLAFFGANAVYWQVRFEPSERSVPNRVMVCYKDAAADPVADPGLKAVRWRDPPVNRPEQTLIGIQYVSFMPSNALYVPYVVANSSSWVYAGTGFKDGNIVRGIVGYEADRMFSTYPAPTAVAGTYTLLSQSPFTTVYGAPEYANSSIYQAPSGAWVFGAGTFGWSWALDDYGSHAPVDRGMQRATSNILRRFSRGRLFAPFQLLRPG